MSSTRQPNHSKASITANNSQNIHNATIKQKIYFQHYYKSFVYHVLKLRNIFHCSHLC